MVSITYASIGNHHLKKYHVIIRPTKIMHRANKNRGTLLKYLKNFIIKRWSNIHTLKKTQIFNTGK